MDVPITVRDLEPEDLPDLDWTGGPEHLQADRSGSVDQCLRWAGATRGGVARRPADRVRRGGFPDRRPVGHDLDAVGPRRLAVPRRRHVVDQGSGETDPGRSVGILPGSASSTTTRAPGPSTSGSVIGSPVLCWRAGRSAPAGATSRSARYSRRSCPERAISGCRGSRRRVRRPQPRGGRRYTARVSMSLIFAALLVTGIAAIGAGALAALVFLLLRSFPVRGG